MALIQSANLALRFLLELSLLVVFGYWGFHTGQSTAMRVVVGIGLPVLVAAIWGLFLAPASHHRLSDPWLLVAEVVIFALAVAALYSASQKNWAWVLALIYLVNRILMYIWRQ